MQKKQIKNRLVSFVLVLAVCVGVSVAPAAAQGGYNDLEAITGHVSLTIPQGLTVSRPSGQITTTDAAYFIAGTSDPGLPLTLNGQEVEQRGVRGSFGVYVALDAGTNRFVLEQGSAREEVIIVRGNASAEAATTTVISRMAPAYDCATFSGETITLSCVAPSGASVTASIGNRQVTLEQSAATAKAGVPATFTAKLTAGEVSGTKDLGQVVYTLNGQTDFESEGRVYITGSGSRLAVQVKNDATVVYSDAQRSRFIDTAKLGGIDTVKDINGDLYELSTGGWVPREAMQPLTEEVPLRLSVEQALFGATDDGNGEVYSFPGSARPMVRSYQDSEKLFVRLCNTTMSSDAVSELKAAVSNSRVFGGVAVSQKDGYADLTFQLSGNRTLWGYDITYGREGGINVFAKYKPSLQQGSRPLAGIAIAVDAGHGGSDPGAVGVPGTKAAMEKDINLATAIAVQKRLESLGATVLMTRSEDENPPINDRMQGTVDADLFISLHCNSISYDRDTNKAGGTEVYYYEDQSQRLAQILAANVADYTGRTNRGAKFSAFRVTLNTYAPAVLVEMGFLTNPAEYDSMTSRSGIFRTANAVGDGVLAVFR